MFITKRKSLFILVAALTLALVLAACSDDDEPETAPAEEEESAEEAEPAEEVEPETVLIGGIHPLTGGLAADGIQMDNAIQMAIAEINAAGGLLDGSVMLDYLSSDSTGAPDVGQAEAERLIGEGAAALICCFQSSVTTNVAGIAEREQVPLVIDVAVVDAILDQGFTYTFRIQPNATSDGVNGADFLVELADNAGEEINSIVYLYEGTTGFGDSVKDAFIARAEELGIEVLDEIAYAPFEVADLTTEMTRVNSLAPDVLVVTGYYGDGLLAARSAEEIGVDVKLVYGVAQGTYDQESFVEDAGDLSECFLNANYHWDSGNPAAEAVRSDFQDQFGEGMRTAAVLSYQSTYIIADAIERAGSADPTAIRDALATTNYADHILPYDGPIQFDETGETTIAKPVVMQVQGGIVNQVWPPSLAQSDAQICTSWGG